MKKEIFAQLRRWRSICHDSVSEESRQIPPDPRPHGVAFRHGFAELNFRPPNESAVRSASCSFLVAALRSPGHSSRTPRHAPPGIKICGANSCPAPGRTTSSAQSAGGFAPSSIGARSSAPPPGIAFGAPLRSDGPLAGTYLPREGAGTAFRVTFAPGGGASSCRQASRAAFLTRRHPGLDRSIGFCERPGHGNCFT
jgi:hypothetical protein